MTVHGHGRERRNQAFALAAVLALDGLPVPMRVLAGGTDGRDGPTDAAGAWSSTATVGRAQALGLDAQDHLQRHDAYPFFQALGQHLMTGPTNTNVMDLHLLVQGPSTRRA
ncbi:MAG: MOFRL family protein [Bacteroidota bacterium]